MMRGGHGFEVSATSHS